MTPIPGQGSLLDAPTTQGRTRASDPATSVTGARRARVGEQKRRIADLFAKGAPYVTADELFSRYPETARGTWSSRLGVLVDEGRLRKGDPVPGASQLVLSYHLTPAGRDWVADLMERVA